MTEPTTEDVLVALLEEALQILESEDLLTKESIPAVRQSLERLDNLRARLGNYDSAFFPRGAKRRLEVIRGGLRIGDARDALRDLQKLTAEVRKASVR